MILLHEYLPTWHFSSNIIDVLCPELENGEDIHLVDKLNKGPGLQST